MNTKLIKFAAFVSAFFGLLTVFAGGSVIFDLFGMRETEGNYVPFVVWANLVCGLLYLIASYGFFSRKDWTATFMKLSLWVLVAAVIVLSFCIWNGELYENKTIVALGFRILVTLGLVWVANSFKSKIPLDAVL
jgi:hypothetical protein